MVTFQPGAVGGPSPSRSNHRDEKVTSFRADALTSYEALVAGGDKMKEILLRRKNANLDALLCEILKEHLKHKLASLYYEHFGDRERREIESRARNMCHYFTACLVGISLSKQLNYGAKGGFHKSCARTLKNIRDQAMYSRTEDRYKSIYDALKRNSTTISVGKNITGGEYRKSMSVKRTSAGDETEQDDASGTSSTKMPETKYKEAKFSDKNENEEEIETESIDQVELSDQEPPQHAKSESTTDSITKQYIQAQEQVDSFVPVKIFTAFNMLDSRIMVINESLLTDKTHSLVAWEVVKPALYYQLAETIIESWGWPITIPSASYTVEKCLRSFKESISVKNDNNADLLMSILDRSNKIRTVQTRLAQPRSYGLKDVYDQLGDLEEQIVFEENEELIPGTFKVPSYGSLT